jgi:hypothetical protein
MGFMMTFVLGGHDMGDGQSRGESVGPKRLAPDAEQGDAKPNRPSESQRLLLVAVLEQMQALGGGVPALKFRADNYSEIATLDQLESGGFLKRENDAYRVQTAILPLLNVESARRLLSNMERVYTALRSRYRQAQQAPVPVQVLAEDVQLPASEVSAVLLLMLDITTWCTGHSNDLLKEDAFVSPSESILRHETFSGLAEEVRSWSFARHTFPRVAISQLIDADEGQQSIQDSARVLPPEQAAAILSVLEDIAGIEFTLNDYYDDLEPQGVLDSVLTGKFNTLRVYCESVGWRGLAAHILSLTPLRGNAVEALELVQSFIVPEVRRLTLTKIPSMPKEPINSESVLAAWPAVRACLQEFNFYDIKAIAGLAGFDVTAAAHLVQKSEGGASKGQLMSAIDGQVGGMDARARSRFLAILSEEVLRRRPEMQDRLAEYLSRLGWSFVSQTLVPLDVFDVDALADTPEESHKDLLKAAQRLRDGDLGGAISAACGAVDTATSAVFQELGLGDPTKASFQERCKRAALAKGVLIELDRQLAELGWPQSEVSPFKKNLEGALNQGAFVMQTLRARMGDVHGTKPILRPLVFDCLRWAELIVGSLVNRPHTP